MAKDINIGGRLHSIATGNVVAGADEILDDNLGKKQTQINTETYSLVESVNNALDALNPDQQEALAVAAKANANEAKLGYYVCDTNADTAAKTVVATNYVLGTGGSIKVKMTNDNTVNNATLNINSTGAKPLFYEGARASSTNTWKAGETVEVYYDGTNFYANNVAGGGGDGVFDVSEKYPTSGVEGSNTYTLYGALAVLNANLPASKKKGGMSIKFVQSSDNKYVQYRLMSATFSTTASNWQGVATSGNDFINPKDADKVKLPTIGAVKEHEHEMLNQYFDQLDDIHAVYGNAGISGLYIDTKNVPDFDSSKLVISSFNTSGVAIIKYDGTVVLSAKNADKEAVKMKRENGGLLDGYIKLDIAAIGRITSSSSIIVNLSPNYKAYDASFFPAFIPAKYDLNIIKPIVYPTASTQTLEPCSCIIDAYGAVLEKYTIIRIAYLRKTANNPVLCALRYGNNENYLNTINGMISNTDWNNGVRTITFPNVNLFIVVSDNIEHLPDDVQLVNGDLRVRYVKDNKTRSSVAPIIKFSDALEEQIKVCNRQSNLAPIPFDTFVVNPDNIYGVFSNFQKYENDGNTRWWYSNIHPCFNPSTYFGRCYRKTWHRYNENAIDDVLVGCVERHTRIGYIGFCMFNSKEHTDVTNNIIKPNNWSEKQSIYENNLSDYSFSFDTSNNFLIDGKPVYTELPNDVIWEMIEENTLPNFMLHTSNGYYMAYPNYNSESLYLWWKSFIEALGSYLNGTITYNGVTYTRKNLVECVRVMCIGIYGEGACSNLCIFPDDDSILRDYFKLYIDNFSNRLLIPMASTYDYEVNLYSDTTWEYLWTLTNDAGLSGVFCDILGHNPAALWVTSGYKLSDNLNRFDMRNRPFNGEFAGSEVNEHGLYTLNYMFKYSAYGVSMSNITRQTLLGKEQITKCAITIGAKIYISNPNLSDNILSYSIQNIGISNIYSPYWKAKYVFRGEDNSLLSEVDANLSVQDISPNSIAYEEAGLIGNGTPITENITIPSGTKKILFKIADIYGVYENYYLHNYGRTEDGEYLLIVLNT